MNIALRALASRLRPSARDKREDGRGSVQVIFCKHYRWLVGLRVRGSGVRPVTASRSLVLSMIAGLSPGHAGAPMQELVVQVPVAAPRIDPELDNVCHLWIRRKAALVLRPKFTGSAVLYRGRYLLTAGHNVYQDRSSVRGIEVRCAVADARAAPAQEAVEAWQAMDATGYNGIGFERDFGVIRLRRTIETRSPIVLAEVPPADGQPIRFAGYPGGPHDGWHMFSVAGRITTTVGTVLSYDIETSNRTAAARSGRLLQGVRSSLRSTSP